MSESSVHTPRNSVIPVHDTPRTPSTPRTPVAVSVAPENSPQLGRESTLLSGLAEGGVWTKFQRSTGPLYNPPIVEVAKRFLRTAFRAELKLPARFRRLPSHTPLSSGQAAAKTRHRMQTRVTVCHGCHLVMGGGNHNGSAPGKNKCTLGHSDLCLGV